MISYSLCKIFKDCEMKKQNAQSIANWVKYQQELSTPDRTIPPEVASYIRNANLQQVLAMLVDGVYSRDKEAISVHHFTKSILEGEYIADTRTELYTALYWKRMEDLLFHEEDEAMVGMKHYLRKDFHPNAAAPRLVIALRGTKISNARDILDDLRVLRSTLHMSARYRKCHKLVFDLIQRFQQPPYNGKPHEIYLTGHSLGAAIALLIAKDLASINPPHRLETHCFNPPFMELPEMTQAGVQELLDKRESYKKLADWVPKLYINKEDLICNRFHRYYARKNINVPSLPVHALMRILGRNDKYITLMPSVDMYVSDYNDSSVSFSAHDLKQWYAKENVKVVPDSYRLLPKTPPAADQYHPTHVQHAQQQPQPQPHSGFNQLEDASYCNPIPWAQPQIYPPNQPGFDQYGYATYPNQTPYLQPQYPAQHTFCLNQWANTPVYGYPYPIAQPQYQTRSIDQCSIGGDQLDAQPEVQFQARELYPAWQNGGESLDTAEAQLAQTNGVNDQRGVGGGCDLTYDQLHYGYEYSSDDEEDEWIPPLEAEFL